MAIQQESLKEQEFIICFVVFEWNDGDSIAELESETVDGVVHKNHILHVNIFDNS